MASSDPQLRERDEDENQEASQLFDSFMEITKDATVLESQPNDTTDLEKKQKRKGEEADAKPKSTEETHNTSKVEAPIALNNEPSSTLETPETPETQSEEKQNNDQEKESADDADAKPESTEETHNTSKVEAHSSLNNEPSSSIPASPETQSNEKQNETNILENPPIEMAEEVLTDSHPAGRGPESVSKRLSKAVDSLSELEQQLSSMISKDNPKIDNPDCVDTDSKLTEVSIAEDDQNQDASDSTDNEDDKTLNKSPKTEGVQVHVNTDLQKLVELQESTENKEEIQVNSNGEKTTVEDDTAEDSSNSTTQTETKNIDNEKPESKPAVTTESRSPEATPCSSEDDNAAAQLASQEEAFMLQEVPSIETPKQNLDQDSTSNEISQVDQILNEEPTAKGPTESNAEESGGKHTSSCEDLPENDTQSASQVPGIEILMTDESGISERKSLGSLDTDLHESGHSCPDSPALSDEGIDSDSKSDYNDDEIFDTDGAIQNKLLDVERVRNGSDSSTISEMEFKSNIPETDVANGEDSDKISMKGYLLKLGGSGFTPRNWRKRWFALKEDNCLYYYKHSKDKIPCGVIILCGYSVTKAPESSKNHCFKLNKGGARSYHFCTTDEEDMRKWMVSLMTASTEVSATGTSFQILEGNVHNVSIPALSIKDPECHGYLSKQGHNYKTWKRRYCVLKNGYLYYYSDMSNTTALGVAKLLGYTMKLGGNRGKHYCFYGNPSDESLRTYHFSAETETDRTRWMTRLEESIQKGTLT